MPCVALLGLLLDKRDTIRVAEGPAEALSVYRGIVHQLSVFSQREFRYIITIYVDLFEGIPGDLAEFDRALRIPQPPPPLITITPIT